MRTTVSLDPDVELALQKVMRERRVGFKHAINDALREGLGLRAVAPVDIAWPTYAMGEAYVDITHAGTVAATLEDDEIAAELRVGR